MVEVFKNFCSQLLAYFYSFHHNFIFPCQTSATVFQTMQTKLGRSNSKRAYIKYFRNYRSYRGFELPMFFLQFRRETFRCNLCLGESHTYMFIKFYHIVLKFCHLSLDLPYCSYIMPYCPKGWPPHFRHIVLKFLPYCHYKLKFRDNMAKFKVNMARIWKKFQLRYKIVRTKSVYIYLLIPVISKIDIFLK